MVPPLMDYFINANDNFVVANDNVTTGDAIAA